MTPTRPMPLWVDGESRRGDSGRGEIGDSTRSTRVWCVRRGRSLERDEGAREWPGPTVYATGTGHGSGAAKSVRRTGWIRVRRGLARGPA